MITALENKLIKMAHSNSPDDVCMYCCRFPTGKMEEDEDVKDSIKELADEYGDGDYEDAFNIYRKAYHTNLPPADDCKVCSDPDVMCYHERHDLIGVCPYLQPRQEIP